LRAGSLRQIISFSETLTMPTHFGDFTLDESRRQLLRDGEAIHLPPKAFQLLSILIEESPRAVSKKDLQERLWPDTFVTEGNLATAVADLRSALGDDRREPRFIRTLYGFGYSFAAPTTEASSQLRKGVRWGHLTTATLIAVVGIVALLSLRSAVAPAQTSASIRSLAVLPFDTSGADDADQHLGLGLPDLLITRLSNVRQLVVRPTSAIREYAGGHIDSRDAGRKLKVDAVLEGSIRTTPDRVRVTVQLLNVQQQQPIWAERFDQKRTEMFAIEDAISQRVADALMMHLTPNEKTRLAKRYTNDPEAYELYIQARYQQERLRREGRWDLTSAIELFEKAVQKDPTYALAWAGLAQKYASLGGFNQLPPQMAFEKAKAAVQKAFQLDDDLSEGHCAAATIKMYWDLDFAGAERDFLRALEVNPRNTIAMMHYAYLLMCTGRFDEGIAMRKREIEVDPLNPAYQSFLAGAYLKARQDDRGIRQCLLVLRMDPNFSEAHIDLARIYTLRGEYDQAIAHARQAIQTGTNRSRGLAFLGYALGMAGKKVEANEILQQLEKEEKVQPFDLAIVHLGLDHREEVLRLLDRAVGDRTYVLPLKTEPIFQSLHSDARFKVLLQHAGFGS
jgi:TolB-like protein/DNA-binding winged helix-turn-helix (wHTH) protein/Tfp pilus assembly protein PilF